MAYSSHRIYIQYGESNCLRFSAPGSGMVAEDGLSLFEWIRNRRNITRLRNGLQHVYELDQEELPHFLEFKLLEDRKYREKQMEKYSRGSEMLSAFGRKRLEFLSLPTGIDMLDAISNATEPTVIPRTSPRKRLDEPGWLYLLNVDQETLEIYHFKNYRPNKPAPFKRLTVESLYQESPTRPRGYYVGLNLSGLQLMGQAEWIELHKSHAESLRWLWKQQETALQTIPHADTIPFIALYAAVSYEEESIPGPKIFMSMRYVNRKLGDIIAALGRRQPSKVSIFESETIQPRNMKPAICRCD